MENIDKFKAASSIKYSLNDFKRYILTISWCIIMFGVYLYKKMNSF